MTKLQTVSKVLEVKDLNKEDLALQSKKIRDRLDNERACLAGLEEKFADIVAAYEDAQTGLPLNVHELELYSDYLLQLEKKIARQRLLVAERAEELAGKQRELLEVHKQAKTLELLKDKIGRDIAREHGQSEQKEMDLLFLQRKARQ